MNKDSKLCFAMANAFYDIGRLANEKDFKAHNSSMLFKRDAFYVFPAVVNLAFSCELYLKALLVKLGIDNDLQHHKLDLLFNKLPATVQRQLAEIFAAKCRNVTLQQTLKTHSKAFEEWRYAFETEKKNIVAYPNNLQLAAEVIGDYFDKANTDL